MKRARRSSRFKDLAQLSAMPLLAELGDVANSELNPARELDAVLFDQVERYSRRLRRLNESDRAYVTIEMLTRGLGLVQAVAPGPQDHEFVREALSGDELLARRTLQLWHRRVHSTPYAHGPWPDDRLLGLWDDQTQASAEALLALPPFVPHALALGALVAA